ncbi:hypothetical protein ACLKMY_37800 [Paraburkholderia mimosarum]|uniref:hypothetical protein n=1 Tax=Paraburkholderia mimosarum TaxID=312026 RepID=UPI0039C177AB
MTDEGKEYRALLDASAAVIARVYAQLDEGTLAILEPALENGFRLATMADTTGLMVVVIDQRTGQVDTILASVNAVCGREKIYRLVREAR